MDAAVGAPPLRSGGGGGEADGGGVPRSRPAKFPFIHPPRQAGARDAPSVTAQIAPRHLPRFAGEEKTTAPLFKPSPMFDAAAGQVKLPTRRALRPDAM